MKLHKHDNTKEAESCIKCSVNQSIMILQIIVKIIVKVLLKVIVKVIGYIIAKLIVKITKIKN